MLTGPANPSRSRADLPCSSSMEKLCARYSTSRQLRTARHSRRCVSAFVHDSAICHNGHRWKARRVHGACTRLESTGRDQRSHLAEPVPLAHVEHPRGKCSAADGPQASERLSKNADAYRHFCPERYLSAELLHFAIVLSITRRLCSSKATVKMPPCLARRTCLIRLAVAHSFVLCGETSTRQCCHTEVSVLPEVKGRGAARAACHTVRSACAVNMVVRPFWNTTEYLCGTDLRARPTGIEGASNEPSGASHGIASSKFTGSHRQRCRLACTDNGADSRADWRRR
jgi:hypothetical protein